MFITSGAGSSAQGGVGGELVMMAGSAEGDSEGDGGRVEIRGGKAVGGKGGDVAVAAGNSYTGDGGALVLQGGYSEFGNGGDVIMDAGDSGTGDSTKEGLIRIAPTSASFVRIGRSGSKTVRTDVFGDLTVHGSFVSTSSMVYQDTYTERVHISTEQDQMIQEEMRVPKITGLDSEDVAGDPTSTLTLDAGQGGTQQWLEIGPWEATRITIGGRNVGGDDALSHVGYRNATPILIRQGYDEADKRLQVNESGAIVMQSSATMPILIHSNPTRGTNGTGGDIDLLVGSGDTGHGGNMTLTAGDTTDDNHRGGFLTLTAGGNNNTAGGRGGVVKVSGGFAGGTQDCDLQEYECAGLNISVAMYEAVLHGCTSDCTFFGNDAPNVTTYLCGTTEVTEEEYLAVMGGCTQKCLGGAVEITGGLASGGVGGAVVLTGGDTNSTDPYGRGGNVEIRGGKASSGSGGSVIMSSGRSEALSSGDVVVQTTSSGAGGVSGAVAAETGAACAGDSGAITVATGSATTGSGGDVNLLVGSGDTENGGAVVMRAGETAADSKQGGGVFITSGAGSSAQGGVGGELVMMAGSAEGDSEGDGGRVEIRGGKAVGGKGGDVAVAAGNSYTGDGGALVLQGGYSEFGNGGDVIMDAGDSGTGDSTKEGLIRIAPTSASFVRIGRSGSKTVRTDVFGDLTVHGSFVSTSSMVYQDTYTERVHISTEQDQMIQEEMRVPKITGLDSEDVAGDPTSTLTLDAGQGGTQQWLEIGPWEATRITIGGRNVGGDDALSHVGYRNATPILIRQGYDEADKRLQVNESGAIVMQSSATMPILIHSNPTRGTNGTGGDIDLLVGSGDTGHGGNMTLTAGDTTDDNHRGGFLTLTAGGNNNTAGGRGGVVKVSGGFAGGTQDCDLQEYECAGLNISVAMYEAVLHGCTSDCTFFGNDAPNVTTYLCGTTEVTEEEYLAVMGGCTQKCLGGAVEITGGLASGGVGGAVVLTGGDTNSTDPYGRGGNVEIRGGKASSGSGGSVIMSSGRSEALSSGDVVVQTTSSGAGGVSGAVAAETGAACAGDSGAITVATGSATTGSGGDVNLLVGSGDTENGGAVVMRAGETAADSKQGGGVFITSGAGSSAQGGVGGELVMMAGSAEGDSEGDGGRVEIRGGKAVGGKGGDVAVAAGNSYTGDGGALVLQGGYSEFGNGGDVIMDAGDSGTGDSTKEGLIRIAPTSASFVRIGRSGSKTVRTDVFGDLTVHGSFVSTSSMVYQDTYTERVHISTEQDQMIQEEMRVPKITGLDSEDVAGDPTSTLTLDAGQGGTQQWLEIGPWEATRITIGGRNVGGDDALSHVGYRNATPILIRQGYDEADKRLQVNESGAIVMQSSATMPILIHSNPTRGTNGTGGDIDLLVGSGDTGHGGNMTLTAGDTTDDNHRGGFLTLTAGGNNNTAGGRGGVVKVSGGFAGGTQDCDLQEYECAGLNISVAMYEAVLHGCTSDCTFFGNDAPNVTTYLCGTTEVTEEEYLAVMGGCTQKCLGGAVEITGGLASGGVGGAVVLTGGDTNSTDPYGRGGNVEIRGGKASSGSGGSVIMSSGRSEALSSGDVVVQTTSSGAGGVSGAVAAETGAACAGDSGAITVATGSATTGSGGDVNLLVGSGDTENGGAVVMRAGETAADSKQGGGVFITSGAGSSAQGGVGGELVMMAGSAEGDSEGDGGRVEIRGGKAVGGKGGDVAVAAGNSYTGDGGALVLQGGYSEFGNGGDVIMDAGDSGTGDSTKEGLIRIAPTSASFVRIGRSGSKTVRTDVFGDLTVHGSFVSTSSMVYQDTYTERVHISTEQDQMIQEEMRVPKITGLDSEDVAGDPTSTLTLDAGQGGTQQWLEIGPWEATRITIGGRNVGGDDALSHVGYRNATPILIRQGYDEADKRLQVNESGAIVMQSSATMPILIHSNPTRGTNGTGGDIDLLVGSGDTGHGGNMTLTAGDTTDDNHRGGFLTLTAGGNNNTAGGRGGVVKVSGGFAGGTQDCDLQEYECAGLNISVAMYEAVLHGCTSDCTFFGNDAPNVTTYLCGTTEVTEEEYLAVMGGCTQKCLGGAVEITGGLASGGVGGAVVLTGGDTNSTDPYGRGGNVEIRGGKASSGSGGSVIMSSGRSEALSSGDVVVQTTSSGAGGVSGAVAAETGAACAGDSGAITVATGSATTGSGGDVNLLVGSGDTENGGAVVMRAGETAADSKQGGGVFITSGAGSSAQGGVGGELVMMAGSAEGDSEGDGGRVEIRGGKAVGGKGGDVAVAAGNSYTGDGGALVLQGGYSEFGNGGDVIMDAGDSGTGDSTKEGLIRIAPTSASFVRIGRSGSKTVRTDVFGDLTVHGSFVSTSSMVYQDTYTERVHISTEQDQMIQEEMRVPKITGLDSEDVAGDPTSTLTLDAGQGGTQQWLEIGPWEATRITIGGRNVGGDDALSHVGYRNATPILIRQGYDEADKRLQVNESGAIVMQSSATMPILIHSNPTRGTNGTGGDIDLLVGSGDTGHGGNMTLTAGDTTDDNHRGGFLTLTAGGNNNTAGGRGGVVKVSGGFAGGTQDCDLQEYECAGLNISVAMYEAVLHGCTSDCTFFGNDAPNVTTYLCGTTEVTEEEYLAVMGGCTQKCLGGAVEITGGLASGGVGGAVVLTGGDTNSTDPYGRGGNVEIRGGKASSGSGDPWIMSSGRSEAPSSGDVVVQTTSSGAGGVSGAVAAETGAACAGDSGAITVATGSATTGSGGDVNLLVGSGDTENGGAVVMRAGETAADSKQGGGVFITSGAGSSAQGGVGGELVMMAGSAEGDSEGDGGRVEIRGGKAVGGKGWRCGGGGG